MPHRATPGTAGMQDAVCPWGYSGVLAEQPFGYAAQRDQVVAVHRLGDGEDLQRFGGSDHSMSAATSALAAARPVQVSPLSGNQAAVPAQEGAGGDQSVRPQPSQSPIT